MKKDNLSDIPQIEIILQKPEIKNFSEKLGRPIVLEAVRSAINEIRESVINKQGSVPGENEIIEKTAEKCRKADKNRLQKVINATGVIIHTNMGRAPIPREVWKEAEEVNCSYSNLEIDLKTGKRGKRKGLIPALISKLTGAEDALIVNNNAAAVFLILKTFAEGKDVIVNRGEQVQIGGGFRIPEILKLSGAGLVETGTTNITTAEDFKDAFTAETAMILSVHRSNFAIRGFTKTPSTKELALIKPDNVILCVDQGSGIIDESLPGEISVKNHIKNGADIVCFSGDKILGSPQAGIIAGKKELIAKMEKNQLMRVFRPGKTVYSLLETSLIKRTNGIENRIFQTLSLKKEDLEKRGNAILKGIDKKDAYLAESSITTGGGTSPDEIFPSLSIYINKNPEKIIKTLREASPPVIAIIKNGKAHINLATIEEEDISHIRNLLQKNL